MAIRKRDPAKCKDATGLLRILKEQHVRWVVISSEYPVDLANAFRELESDGKLTPIASKTIESLAGNSRIYKQTAASKQRSSN